MIKINVQGEPPQKIRVSESTTLNDLINLLSWAGNKENLQILHGFPQQVVHGEPHDLLTSLDIKTGDNLHAREGSPISMRVHSDAGEGSPALPSVPCVHSMKRFVIDADNSCLFRCIGFCIGFAAGELTTAAAVDCEKFRRMVADAVLTQTDNILCTEAMLEKPPEEYASWIMHPDHWGGEIELSLLSLALQISIQIVDVESGCVLSYNAVSSDTDNRLQKVYLIFDGIHYDCLVRGELDGPEVSATLLDAGDVIAYQQCLDLCRLANAQKAFTNIKDKKGGFQLRCLVCQDPCIDADAARVHASTTGHQNFGQYS